MDTRLSIVFGLFRDEELRMRHRSLKTEESYYNVSKLLVEYFGDMPIENLQIEDARDWHAHLSGWQRPDTVRGNICCLRMVLKWIAKKGVPVLDYELIPVAGREKRTVNYLTHSEASEFIAELRAPRRGHTKANRLRNYAIGKLIYASGLRVSEVAALNKNSIRDRQVTVVGKSKDPKLCFIDIDTEEAIGEYLQTRGDSERAMFISSQTGKRITTGTIRRIFENVCSRTGFAGVTPHTLRHSFATKLLDREVDLRYIGDLLGHQDLNTTKMYTHYSNPKLKAIYDNAHAY